MISQIKGYGRVPKDPKHRIFWPHGVVVSHSQHIDVFNNPEALQTPYLGILRRIHQVGIIDQ